ncbi:hypothetical protein EMIHUDRAFT_247208 [Emiliania huxleyi CCMP1516]|uniref:AAR2 splicing factor homolog n=2 Tax=Emiliania huxleyi TaxID=2903 RepID=A0A0D3IP14_EMIH1|nr:hypothetical protein EMIHUDRAFT_247208 [Emiliania huxleyi CCMP1516]EOD12999.1 hypothetical protein EMIHUDRAFT_247208 [Emiliania huxleyi CCMP1516]|eukprot:XP_005765428.1 hypothetical protein EMIHUDRAFT_247208 [Emiliania huxleyi CCMP1516]
MSGPDVPSLDPEEALQLTQRGGTLVCLGLPAGREFGVDLRSYTVGDRFGGMKMIPTQGVHFLVFGTDMDRTGCFVSLAPSEVAVFRLSLDASLGPYPLGTWGEWAALTQHISPAALARAAIAPPTLVAAAPRLKLSRLKPMWQRRPHPPLPGSGRGAAQQVAQQVAAHLKAARRVEVGAVAVQLRSEWLGWLLAHEYSPPPDSSRLPARAADGLSACEAGLLGELQLSFLLFLRLSCLASLEQWKRLVSLLLRAFALERFRIDIEVDLADEDEDEPTVVELPTDR